MKPLHQINVGEIALHKDIKVNSIETRFSAIKSRHKINVGTTTDGFTKPKNASTTPKKKATATKFSPLMIAVEGPSPTAQEQGRGGGGGAFRPKRTPKPTARKRQADEQDSWYDEDRGSTSPSKRHMSDMDVDVDEEGQEDGEAAAAAAAWHAVAAQGHYAGYYVMDGAKHPGY